MILARLLPYVLNLIPAKSFKRTLSTLCQKSKNTSKDGIELVVQTHSDVGLKQVALNYRFIQ